ncbi:ISPsy3 [Pseudomonas savastanoi]|nr:ISPsy3 [Pseudomonas savastanoi]
MFTLPDTLWPLFFHNRHWLDALCRLAVDNLLYAGRRRGVEVGVFCAIHT